MTISKEVLALKILEGKTKEDFLTFILGDSSPFRSVMDVVSMKDVILAIEKQLKRLQYDFQRAEMSEIRKSIRKFLEIQFIVHNRMLSDLTVDAKKKAEIREDIKYCKEFLSNNSNSAYFPIYKDVVIFDVPEFSLDDVQGEHTADEIDKIIHEKLQSRSLMNSDNPFVLEYNSEIQKRISTKITQIISGYEKEISEPCSISRRNKIFSEVKRFYELFKDTNLAWGPNYYFCGEDFPLKHHFRRIIFKINIENFFDEKDLTLGDLEARLVVIKNREATLPKIDLSVYKKRCENLILSEKQKIKNIESELTKFLESAISCDLSEQDFNVGFHSMIVGVKKITDNPVYINSIEGKMHDLFKVYQQYRERGVSSSVRGASRVFSETIADIVDGIGHRWYRLESRKSRIEPEVTGVVSGLEENIQEAFVRRTLTDFFLASIKLPPLQKEDFNQLLNVKMKMKQQYKSQDLNPSYVDKIMENKDRLFNIYKTCREQGISPYIRRSVFRLVIEKVADFIDYIGRGLRGKTREQSMRDAVKCINLQQSRSLPFHSPLRLR